MFRVARYRSLFFPTRCHDGLILLPVVLWCCHRGSHSSFKQTLEQSFSFLFTAPVPLLIERKKRWKAGTRLPDTVTETRNHRSSGAAETLSQVPSFKWQSAYPATSLVSFHTYIFIQMEEPNSYNTWSLRMYSIVNMDCDVGPNLSWDLN